MPRVSLLHHAPGLSPADQHAAPAAVRCLRELQCDVAVIGGGFGGVAAALGALRNGQRVVLTEETDWIGGQVTSQAVPPGRARLDRVIRVHARVSLVS